MLEMKYFVLRPGKNDDHGRASQAAIFAYARTIKPVDPELSRDLCEWVDRVTPGYVGS